MSRSADFKGRARRALKWYLEPYKPVYRRPSLLALILGVGGLALETVIVAVSVGSVPSVAEGSLALLGAVGLFAGFTVYIRRDCRPTGMQ